MDLDSVSDCLVARVSWFFAVCFWWLVAVGVCLFNLISCGCYNIGFRFWLASLVGLPISGLGCFDFGLVFGAVYCCFLWFGFGLTCGFGLIL